MGWRDRAVAVQPEAAAAVSATSRQAGSWRDRASPVQAEPSLPDQGAASAFGHNLVGGFTKQWGDELVGAISRLDPRAQTKGAALRMLDGSTRFMDSPEQIQDAATDLERQKLESGLEHHPIASIAGNALGEIGSDATAALLGVPGVTSLPYQLASGAFSGAGAATEETPGGRLGGAAIGTAAAGAGYGLGKYVVGPAVSLGARGVSKVAGKIAAPVREFVQKRIQGAVDDEVAKQTLLAEKNINSAQGSYRSAVQSASRDLEVLMREADALPDGPAKQQIQEFLSSPEAVKLREQVAGNKLDTAPERISEMQGKLDQFKALVANKDENIALQAGEALRQPFQKHILPRVATLGHRFLPIALPAAGYALAGPEGGAVGTGAAGVLALAQGRPGIVIRNLARSPAVRKVFWEKVLGAIPEPDKYARFIPMLENAAAEGEQKFAVSSFVLQQQNPAARELFARMAQVAQNWSPDDEPQEEEIAAR